MDTNKLLSKSATSEKNLASVSLIEEIDDEKLSGEKQNEATTPDTTMLLAPIYFLVFTVSLMFLKISKSDKAGKNRIITLKRLNQIPCRNCRFFKDNQYLKCAVHPSNALKEEAINCPDYCPRNDKFTSVN